MQGRRCRDRAARRPGVVEAEGCSPLPSGQLSRPPAAVGSENSVEPWFFCFAKRISRLAVPLHERASITNVLWENSVSRDLWPGTDRIAFANMASTFTEPSAAPSIGSVDPSQENERPPGGSGVWSAAAVSVLLAPMRVAPGGRAGPRRAGARGRRGTVSLLRRGSGSAHTRRRGCPSSAPLRGYRRPPPVPPAG